MSGTAVHKRTSLHDLLDQFVDAQRLDIKAYTSGHLNESKLYCLSDQVPHTLWTEHNRSPVRLQTLSREGISTKSQMKVKPDAVIAFMCDGQMKQCYKLKPSKSTEFPEFAKDVDFKYITSNAASRRIMSVSESQEGLCQVSKDEQKNAKLFDSADVQHAVSGIFLPSVVPTHFKAVTKKDQFRKMRDYHNNVIRHPTYPHQHAVTGSDAVKYLERRLRMV